MKQYLSIATFLFLSVTAFSQVNKDESLFDTTSVSNNNKQRKTWSGTVTNDVFNNSQRRHPSNHDFYNSISNKTFLNELRKIRSIRNTYNKRIYAKRLITDYNLTVKHISALANLMQGYSKLDILQYAYTRCIDSYNYSFVYQNLPFDMRQELEDYINYIDNNFAYNNDDDFDYLNDYGYNAMSPQNFIEFKNTLESISFDETKLSTAKSILKQNLLKTDQVIEICRLFNFESNKLEFAQYAYDFTIDKQNYFKVNNVFDFDSSKTALNKTITQ